MQRPDGRINEDHHAQKPAGKPWSGTAPAALSFVIVSWIEIDGAESLQNTELLAVFDILRERGGDRFFLGLVTAGAAGRFGQAVRPGKDGGPEQSLSPSRG